MKLPELRNRLKNKYVVKVVAGVLTIALVGGCVGTYTVKAEKNDTVVSEEGAETTEAEEVSEDDSLEDELLGKVSVSKKDMDKEETVYFIADASGNVDKTIVSDHLYNRDGKDTIEDVSSLSDIEKAPSNLHLWIHFHFHLLTVVTSPSSPLPMKLLMATFSQATKPTSRTNQ